MEGGNGWIAIECEGWKTKDGKLRMEYGNKHKIYKLA